MSSTATFLSPSFAELRELGQQLRVDSIRASDVKTSGHPTSSMSAADLMAVLFAKYLRYDFDQPENRLNDHLIFSKGHASPLLYSLYLAAGAISEEELLSFRTFGSRLQGHPTPLLPVGIGLLRPDVSPGPRARKEVRRCTSSRQWFCSVWPSTRWST